jgi:hypothetical protein
MTTTPDEGEVTMVPKSRSSILVSVSGTRRSALPVAGVGAATGAAAVGIAAAASPAAMIVLVQSTESPPHVPREIRWNMGKLVSPWVQHPRFAEILP